MSGLKKPPKVVRTCTKSVETMRKEEEEMIKKMTPEERDSYLKDKEEMWKSYNTGPLSLLDSTAPTLLDSVDEKQKVRE